MKKLSENELNDLPESSVVYEKLIKISGNRLGKIDQYFIEEPKTASDHSLDVLQYILHDFLNQIPPFPKGGHCSEVGECAADRPISIKEVDDLMNQYKVKKAKSDLDKLADTLKEMQELINNIKI